MAKACGVLAAGALGFAAPLGLFDEHPPWGDTPTVFVTQTETVQARYQGWTARRWAAQSTKNRREANLMKARYVSSTRHVRALQRSLRARWTPTVAYALELARVVYGVDQRRRAFCESRWSPFARNASGASGLLQFLPSTWRSTPFGGFSIFDPVAQALAGGWMVAVAHRSREWSCSL